MLEDSRRASLSPDEFARFSRHIILPGIGQEGQERLKGSRVLIIGLGGLGSPASLYLAAAGVGTLGLADFDSVEVHNLQRQVIHDTPSVGRKKIESATNRLSSLYPEIEIVALKEGITPGNAVSILQDYDVIVDGSDNFGTRYLVNDAAFFAKRPLVYGSVFQFEGQVSVFDPSNGAPCYRCLFPHPPEPGAVPNCAEAGVFGALCGTIGSLQAMEAVKWITGAGEPHTGKLLVLDSLTMQFRSIRLKKDPSCPLCGNSPTINQIEASRYEDITCEVDSSPGPTMSSDLLLEMPPSEANQRFESDSVYILDVREPYEWEICHIAGSLRISLGNIPHQADSLPKDKPILTLCHHGMRSERAAMFLRQIGFEAVSNISGGIHQWAEDVDPSMRRY